MIKKIAKIVLIVFIAIIVIIGLYLSYAYAAYYRLEDNISINIDDHNSQLFTSEETHRLVSNNIGFGAYSNDFTFFMDGGKESWGFSKEAVDSNVKNQVDILSSLNPDILLIQEIDFDSTRSYHIDEKELVLNELSENGINNLDTAFAQNYDSPFLFWPLYQPHGKSKAGIMTLSKYDLSSSIRRSLPIEEGFSKFFDLDRCYTKNYIPCDNGKQLVIYNVHLSAYTTDPTTAINQVVMLNDDMINEYNSGNYVIAGGDMNKDLLGDSTKYYNTQSNTSSWAVAFPTELLDSHLSLIAPVDKTSPVPSCRNCDVPYDENTFVITVDGFIISDNIEVIDTNTYNAGFKYSDHNPVYIDYILK